MLSDLRTAVASSPAQRGAPAAALGDSRPRSGIEGRRHHAAPSDPERDIAIEAVGVGKRYCIYNKPSDRLKQAVLLHRRKFYREFWAVRNVSFTVHRGEGVGIIGRNGSGKSTLLQMVAGVMSPTEGVVRARGRVAAMLELGSGFNPEFTGRENVYLNGSILGISKREMDERFDDIAAFADIGEFIDRPIKTYSSGMQARLAFAVNTAIDPDILIVDEILSVGDLGFARKCSARLRRLRDDGLTLLFVSHSPDSVKDMCDKGLLLERGQALYFGTAKQATGHYTKLLRDQENALALRHTSLPPPVPIESNMPAEMRFGTGHAQLQEVRLLDRSGEPCKVFRLGDEIVLECRARATVDLRDLSFSFLVRDQLGVDFMGTTTFDERVELPPLRAGEEVTVRFVFENVLRHGNFVVSVAVNSIPHGQKSENVLLDQADGCVAFKVLRDPDRPVHYKFRHPVTVSWLRSE